MCYHTELENVVFFHLCAGWYQTYWNEKLTWLTRENNVDMDQIWNCVAVGGESIQMHQHFLNSTYSIPIATLHLRVYVDQTLVTLFHGYLWMQVNKSFVTRLFCRKHLIMNTSGELSQDLRKKRMLSCRFLKKCSYKHQKGRLHYWEKAHLKFNSIWYVMYRVNVIPCDVWHATSKNYTNCLVCKNSPNRGKQEQLCV